MNASGLAWALERAVRFAIATAVVALVISASLSGEGAERLATTAYLAIIFVAVALAAKRFLPSVSSDDPKPASALFPSFLTFSIGVAVFLSVVASLVAQPGAELLVIVSCLGLVLVAVTMRSGSLAALNARLMRGGLIVAAGKYVASAGVVVLIVAATLSGDSAETAATLGYRLMLLATVLLAAALIVPTPFGALIKERYGELVRALDKQGRTFIFERTASYAAIVAAGAVVPASMLPQPFSEPFAITTYVAAIAAAFGVAMECRRLRG